MDALTWWRILVLVLFFYNMLAIMAMLYYFYGVCRLAELKFESPTYPFLVPAFFFIMFAASFPVALSPTLDLDKAWYGLPMGVASFLLLLVSYKCYGVMMGK